MPSGKLIQEEYDKHINDMNKEIEMGSGADDTKEELNSELPNATGEQEPYYIKEPEGDVVASRGGFTPVDKPKFEDANKIDEVEEIEESSFDTQVGGSHYKDFAIQPWLFAMKNKLSPAQYNILKRTLRYDLPTGKGLEDLKKIKHEVDMLIELEGWGKENPCNGK